MDQQPDVHAELDEPAALAQLAHDIDRVCRLEGEFVVRSGAVVPEYFDK
jgi:orotate phosphoribosyltransferase